uniref:Uncharacterized protein n=1 Tax=Anguilla anguilla TaxID=7936 RepID=A0A0E9TLM9_ANGAN
MPMFTCLYSVVLLAGSPCPCSPVCIQSCYWLAVHAHVHLSVFSRAIG